MGQGVEAAGHTREQDAGDYHSTAPEGRYSDYLTTGFVARGLMKKKFFALSGTSFAIGLCLLWFGAWRQLGIGRERVDLTDETTASRQYYPEVTPILPLQELCHRITWQEGLTFVCTNNAGGIGNVAARILACLQFAIDVGAGLILPDIARRDEDLSQIKSSGSEPFSYLFDEGWFRANLALSCPQMTLLNRLTDIPDFSDAYLPPILKPLDFTDNPWLNFEVELFPNHLQLWLNRTSSVQMPVIVRLDAAIFEYPARRNENLYSSYARILKFNDRAYDLAYQAFSALSSIRKESEPRYIGGHLRTEADIAGLDLWASYKTQRDVFFDFAKTRGISLIYVASGSRDDLERIRQEAEQVSLTVVTKFDLLDHESKDILTALSFDQQALVDYLMLRNSTFFIGSSPSSFSFELAYSRHSDISSDFFAWPSDERSHIIGEDFVFANHGMWPLADSLSSLLINTLQ